VPYLDGPREARETTDGLMEKKEKKDD